MSSNRNMMTDPSKVKGGDRPSLSSYFNQGKGNGAPSGNKMEGSITSITSSTSATMTTVVETDITSIFQKKPTVSSSETTTTTTIPHTPSMNDQTTATDATKRKSNVTLDTKSNHAVTATNTSNNIKKERKKPITSTTPITKSNHVKTNDHKSSSTTTTIRSYDRPKVSYNPIEWHNKLMSKETIRQYRSEQKYEQNMIQYIAVQQLLTDALTDTSMSYRYTDSILQLQNRLAHTLILKESSYMNDDIDDYIYYNHTDEKGNYDDHRRDSYNQMIHRITMEEPLPEKMKHSMGDDNDDDEETDISISGSFVEGNINEVAVIVTAPPEPNISSSSLSPLKLGLEKMLSTGTAISNSMNNNNHSTTTPTNSSKTGWNDSDMTIQWQQPPVFAIRFPNPNNYNEAYNILHKQHELIQQTIHRSGVTNSTMDKVQQIKDLCHENYNKLQELAGMILHNWKIQEQDVQKLWNTYLAAAEEVVETMSKPTSSTTDGIKSSSDMDHHTNKSKLTASDVWLAELYYRNAVKQQEIDMIEQEQTLQSLIEMVKDGERQRRLRLRKHIQVDVLQKHANVFQRLQLAHAEALENFLIPNRNEKELHDTDEYHPYIVESKDSIENDSAKVKKTKKSKRNKHVVPKPTLSVQEQIKLIAEYNGATAYWDDIDSEEKVSVDPLNETVTTAVTESEESYVVTDSNAYVVTDSNAIDLDSYVGDSSEEEDLPLLKDTASTDSGRNISPDKDSKRSNTLVNETKSPDTLKVTHADKDDNKNKFKVNNVVILDKESDKHAYFMDRLLYSGSLLESHFVQFAAVVGIDSTFSTQTTLDNESKNASNEGDEAVTKNALLIITSDNILHVLEIPQSTAGMASEKSNSISNNNVAWNGEISVVPGCRPDEALQTLLIQNAKSDLILKEQETLQASTNEKTPPPSPSKLSFRRPKLVVKEESKCFQFSNLHPTLSMPLSECIVRQNLGGESSVRISHVSQNPRVSSSKLNFASLSDQKAFIEASQTEVKLWDLM